MRTLAAGILAVGLLAPMPAGPAPTDFVCVAREVLTSRLLHKYGERRLWAGFANDGVLYEVWTRQGGFSLLSTLPNGQTCLYAAGEDWWPGIWVNPFGYNL